jgi:hypothetical protein
MYNEDHEILEQCMHTTDHLNTNAWANQSQSYFFSDPFGGYYIVYHAIYESKLRKLIIIIYLFILFYSILWFIAKLKI